MCMVGKCPGQKTSHTFYATNKLASYHFLVDMGAEACFPFISSRPPLTWESHQVTNGSRIATYGLCSLSINIRLSRTFQWVFIIAMWNTLSSGQTLSHFNLDISVRRHFLDNSSTTSTVQGMPSPLTTTSIRYLPPTTRYGSILREFPSITKPCRLEVAPHHYVKHHIVTSGRLSFLIHVSYW